MYKYRSLRILLFLLCTLLNTSTHAQSLHEQTEQLFEKFKTAARFDYKYPREKVYVHFDNTAYLTGDTIWYKAYVVRASSLKPTTLSKVLYVELLNADGQNVVNQVLRIDSMGTAQGAIPLGDTVYPGYYEVRAYTREMVNWGKYACFSRVLPVFTDENPQHKKQHGLDLDLSQLSIPLPEPRKTVTIGQPRPYGMTTNKKRMLDFYPEGGERVKGVDQLIAFKLTDGTGLPVEDTLSIFYADGRLCTTTQPLHDGMGTFLLPADFDKGYAHINGIKKSQIELPLCTADYYLGVTEHSSEGITIKVTAADSICELHKLLAIALFNRENACFFDTLTVNPQTGTELFIPNKALRAGVSRFELFNIEGQGLATRLVWNPLNQREAAHKVSLQVKQNQHAYDPFSPVALVLKATRGDGSIVKNANLSVAVRDEANNIITTTDGGIEASMLLASELRGYIHRPDRYFERNDAAHRFMLDLLMLVQGWQANSFDVMCQRDSFALRQPIEDSLLIKGTLYKYNNKKEPYPNIYINLMGYAYNDGKVGSTGIEAQTKTDHKGHFAFEAKTELKGDFLVTFKLRDENNKRKWSKLSLDRWFAPPLCPIRGPQLSLQPYEYATNNPNYTNTAAETKEADLFEWKDTIKTFRFSVLKPAEVVAHVKKYKGLQGGRSTFNGGERNGIKHCVTYYNVQRECERLRDFGINDLDIFQFFDIMNWKLSYNGSDYTMDSSQITSNMATYAEEYYTLTNSKVENAINSHSHNNSTNSQSLSHNEVTQNNDEDINNNDNPSENEDNTLLSFTIKGHNYTVYVNNLPPSVFFRDEDDKLCSNFKSASIVKSNLRIDGVSGEEKRFSNEKDKIYLFLSSDEYRRRTGRGKESRQIQGFTPAIKYYSPNYRKFDLPSKNDTRRTLLWSPQIKTNDKGEATIILFTNARENETLDISVRGITEEGELINWN
uniref:MG2 domain-containing protein n=1 Tax=Alloprevotella sp. TaxID=1872471 RepID=UPI0040295CA2